jgi:hypothetical protein
MAFGGCVSSAARQNDWSFNESQMIAATHDIKQVLFESRAQHVIPAFSRFPIKSNSISRVDSPPTRQARVYLKGV